MEIPEGCTCWMADQGNGAVAPARWVSLHRSVCLITTDGRTAIGYSYGPEWCGPAEIAEVVIEVEPDGGDPVSLPLSQVGTLTPVGDLSDPLQAVQQVARLVASPRDLPVGEDSHVLHIVDAHTTLEITIRKEVHSCLPGRSPYPGVSTPVH